jgi:hypothetical protein
LHFAVDPELVGGNLTLTRSVVLAARGSQTDPLTAQAIGGVLWRESRRDAHTVGLEPTPERLSTEILDFDRMPQFDRDAAWQLDLDLDDLDASPSRTLRLLVNAAHPAIDRLLTGDEDEATRATESVLRWDVARQLVGGALQHDEFVGGAGQFRPSSVGWLLERLLGRWFPDMSVTELHTMASEQPAHLEGLLQARLDLLRAP